MTANRVAVKSKGRMSSDGNSGTNGKAPARGFDISKKDVVK